MKHAFPRVRALNVGYFLMLTSGCIYNAQRNLLWKQPVARDKSSLMGVHIPQIISVSR